MRGKRNVHGLYPRNFPRVVRELVDQDYASKLDPKAQEWLAKFNDEYYGGKVRKKSTRLHGVRKQRDNWVRLNHNKLDAWNQPRAYLGLTGQPEPTEERDETPTPGYLEDLRYKKAVAVIRKEAKNGGTNQARRAAQKRIDRIAKIRRDPEGE